MLLLPPLGLHGLLQGELYLLPFTKIMKILPSMICGNRGPGRHNSRIPGFETLIYMFLFFWRQRGWSVTFCLLNQQSSHIEISVVAEGTIVR